MHIEKILIFNYRSCQQLELDLTLNSPNVFIGLNDSGKSSVLNALDLLLGDKPKYNSLAEGNYKSDLSNSQVGIEQINEYFTAHHLPEFEYRENSTIVAGKLKYQENEETIINEKTLSALLSWSLECNEDKTFWIVKEYSSIGNRIFVLAAESQENLKLWNAKAAEIKKLIKIKGITDEEIENDNGVGRFSNIEQLRAIYSKDETALQWIEFKYAKSDKDIFPVFALFDWNTSLDEIVATANAIMKDEIEQHLTPIKETARESAEKAEIAINNRFGEISEIIQEVARGVEKISSRVHFDVKERISDIMVTKEFSDGPIHLESQGEGLKRQIWFSLIKAKASEDIESENKFIWAFDEPETHLYPGAQREFFDILNKISLGNVQTVLSTHSTIFIDKSNLNKINSVKQNNTGYTEINGCKNIESIFSTLSIKNSDFLFYNKFLIVEGDTELYLIPKLYQLHTDRTLIADNIQILNIQGKDNWNKSKQIIDNVLGDFKKLEDQIIYLFDNDMSFVIGDSVKTDKMFFVGDQDIEDSLPNSLWTKALNKHYLGTLEFTIEEVVNVKESVVKNVKCQDHEKFYPSLKRMVKNKYLELGNDFEGFSQIPSKGAESADFIYDSVESKDDIPDTIRAAFDKLNEENS